MSGIIRTGFSVGLAIAAWSGGTNGPELRSTNGVFHIGANEINPKTLMLKRGKTTEELTGRELKIAQLMHAHPGEVFSRDRLLTEVWGYNYFGTTRTLDQCIVQIRKKLGDPGEQPKHLLTVHGVGYKMTV